MYTELYPEWVKTNVETKSADFTAKFGRVYLVDNGANSVNVALPIASINQVIVIKHTGADLVAFAMTITPQVGDNMDGVAGLKTVTSPYSSTTLASDGADWFIV